MTGKASKPDKAAELRRRAELRTRKQALGRPLDVAALTPKEARRIVHELRVHQIELEMQNEELRRVQVDLDTARERYFDLYDLAPVGYVTVCEKGLILEANLTAARLLGVTRGALTGKPFTRFILKEDQDIQYRYRKALLETGKPQSCELRMTRPAGATFWAVLNAVAYRDAERGPVFRITVQDITERKRSEGQQAKLETQLAQARKMESVGQLAGGVAHDFNNMLGIILGHTELIQDLIGPDEPLRADLDEIRKAAQHSADLTRKLLAFARRQTAAPKVLHLNEAVEGLLVMLQRLIGEDIGLAWLPGSHIEPVFIDPSQVEHILANLCVNARDAIAGVGRITVETGAATFNEAYCADHAGFVPGEFVMLTVSDNGCGMDAETRSHLFEPFFTTKPIGVGTGLGLATVYGVVMQNNGFIDVRSEPGHGTTFKIYLPRHAAKEATQPGQ